MESAPYRMQRRAELEERTRLRITESTVELHGTVGPAKTSVTAVAEGARACAARRSTGTSPTRRRCSPPAARTGGRRTRRPTSSAGPRCAIRTSGSRRRWTSSTASTARPRGSWRTSCATARRCRSCDELLGRYRGYLEAAGGVLMDEAAAAGGARREAGRDRPRARVRDLALAGSRSGASKTTSAARAHVPTRRGGVGARTVSPHPRTVATPHPIRGLALVSARAVRCDRSRMPKNASAALRELDHRVSDGIDVRLLWRPQDDRVLVAVADAKDRAVLHDRGRRRPARGSTSSVTRSRTPATGARTRRAPASSPRCRDHDQDPASLPPRRPAPLRARVRDRDRLRVAACGLTAWRYSQKGDPRDPDEVVLCVSRRRRTESVRRPSSGP